MRAEQPRRSTVPAVRRLRPRVGPRIAARVPEGFDTRPYERFSVEPLAPTIGAEVGGVSLADPIDDALHAELNRALLEWKVLFFRRTSTSPGSSRPTSRPRWGELEHHPFVTHHVADQPDGAPRGRPPREGRRRQGRREHLAQRRHLAGGARRSARCCAPSRCPPVGGDTLWADMGAAYDLLPDGRQGARSTG